MLRALVLPVMIATVALVSNAEASSSVVLGLAVTGRDTSRVKLYVGSGYAANDSAVPFFDARIQPGERVTVPFGACIWWKRSIGASNIDWTPLQYACPPRSPRGAPSPYVVWIAIQN